MKMKLFHILLTCGFIQLCHGLPKCKYDGLVYCNTIRKVIIYKHVIFKNYVVPPHIRGR